MKRTLAAALAALLLVGAAAPAFAHGREGRRGDWNGGGYDRRGDRDHDRRGGNWNGWNGGGWNNNYNYNGYNNDWRRHDRRERNDAIIAGVLGLAVGAIIGSAATQRSQPQQQYYNQGYQPYQPYGGGYEQNTCWRNERQWDPYAGRNVTVQRAYPC